MEILKDAMAHLKDAVDKGVQVKGGVMFIKENWDNFKKTLVTLEGEISEEEKRRNLTHFSSSGEAVNHPKHYKGNRFECIDVMQDVFGKEKTAAFCELNAFKYQWRADKKGAATEDKKKAIWYLNKYLELNLD